MAAITFSLDAKIQELLMLRTINRAGDTSGYLYGLLELQETILAVRKVLLDGEIKWDQLPNQDRDLIRELKDVVYDADDHVDELLTFSETIQLIRPRKIAKFYQKMSRELKDIQKRFDVIRFSSRFLMLYINDDPMKMTRSTNSSYVDPNNIIIGRDKDKDAIITMFVDDPFRDRVVRFYSIVGVGGLGKTSLAQLVFRDYSTIYNFVSRLWVSVSDIYEEQFDAKTILCKILESATNQKYDADHSTLEWVKTQFLQELKGRKYFLVLDDVWNEEFEKWLDLKRILMLSERGSTVLVTTRSMRTATITGDRNDDIYMLQGLSNEDSWRLFEMLAFPTGSEEENHHELVQIGKSIVENCSCNPLAINVVGNHLSAQPISMWESFRRSGLARFGEGDNGILPIYKLSFQRLEPLTQSCFRYCAIFPKDIRIRKEKMIGLWIAQGYIVPSHSDESIEDVAEEQFLNLLDRCFFEDVVRDEYGDVEFFKIHSLMHDVAKEVGQEEIQFVTSIVDCLGNNIRHVRHVGDECVDISVHSKKIRSYVSGNGTFLDTQIDYWMWLRVLDLSWCGVTNLPDSVGKLVHLRYIDLSHNKNLELICDSITQLYKLQTLDLYKCDNLTCMPSGMNKLTNLRVLPFFVVGNLSSEKKSGGMLQDLEALRKIKGKFCVKIGPNYRNEEEGVENGRGYLKSMDYLQEIRVEFNDGVTRDYNPEAVLDELEPPPKIKGIILHNYKGTKMGRWGRADYNWSTSFPCLVCVVIWKCGNLQQMPILSELPFLKILSLSCLGSLEYIENGISSSSSDKVAEFFPSLETLKIMWMDRLKGWWKMDGVVENSGLRFRFPSLLYLKIYKCPNLMSFAPCQSSENMTVHEFPALCSLKISHCPNLAFNLFCPTVETVKLRGIGERLSITCSEHYDNRLRFMEIDNVRYIKSIPTYFLTQLCIHGDLEIKSLLEAENVFSRCYCTLRELEIRYCVNLRELSGLERLTALKELKLLGNDQLSISEDIHQYLFHKTLVHLKLDALPKMKSLPRCMQYTTSLQILELRWCENLEELPQWMNCLSSLESLSIVHCPRIRSLPEAMKDLTSLKNLSIQHGCPELNARCENPDGEDFHIIQHIPNIFIGSCC